MTDKTEPTRAPARGVVLAGGQGRRLGSAKAIATLGGRPLISYPLAALAEAGLDPAVVAKADTELPGLGAPLWLEPATPRHPLLGVVTALRRAGGAVLCCACDMPFVTAELAAWLAGLDAPLAVPEEGGRLQPLLARYGPELLGPLEAALERRLPLSQAIAALDPVIVGEDELRRFGDPARLLFNVNGPVELARAERLLAGRDPLGDLT